MVCSCIITPFVGEAWMFLKLALFSVRKALYAVTKLPPCSNTFKITGQNKPRLKMSFISFFESSMCIPLTLLCFVVQSPSPVGLFWDPLRTLWDPLTYSPPGFSVHGIFPGKNNGVGCYFLLQEIFPDQGLNLRLLHWQVDSLPLSHQGSPHPTLYSFIYDFNE